MIERKIAFSPPDITELEIEEVIKALKSGWITTGPRTKLLERRLAAFLDAGRTDIDCSSPNSIEKFSNKVVCLNCATASEELNLRILGIGDGDEVIVPAYTYTSTASAVVHCGAKPVFVDIQKNGSRDTHLPEIDYDSLEKAISRKTKAIILVDLGGIIADYNRVFEIVERKKSEFVPKNECGDLLEELSSRIQNSMGRIAVIADCAHSLGAYVVDKGEKKYSGKIADFSSFSFHAVKNLTTAEGGAATWKSIEGVDDREIYDMYQLLSLHGQSKDALAKSSIGAWEYDIVGPWYKCNMTDVLASIGLKQLDRYLKILEKRKEMIFKYDEMCDRIGVFHMNHYLENSISSGHLYLTRIFGVDEKGRNEIIRKIAEKGVPTNVHYKPLPMMTAYRNLGWDISDFPNSYDYYKNLITLPLHTCLNDKDIEYIIEVYESVIEKYIR